MTEQQPADIATESVARADDAVQGEQSQRDSDREWFFNLEVHEEAVRHGWRPFHHDGLRVVRGRGFPDVAMFRQHPETGQFEMLVAELKRDEYSEFGEGQEDWLEAFKQMGITTKVWLGNNQEHRSEMYSIIENGTSGHESVTRLDTQVSTSPIPFDFSVVMGNTIESIEGKEMTTGDKSKLRRMVPANPDSAAFWRIMSQRGISRNADIKKWGLIIHGIALMSHNSAAHNPGIRIGRALYEGNGNNMPFYSNDRLATLLSARGDTLHRLLARLFRMLGTHGCAFNWRDMAWFILNEGYNEERADQAKIEIARAYYQAERRNS